MFHFVVLDLIGSIESAVSTARPRRPPKAHNSRSNDTRYDYTPAANRLLGMLSNDIQHRLMEALELFLSNLTSQLQQQAIGRSNGLAETAICQVCLISERRPTGVIVAVGQPVCLEADKNEQQRTTQRARGIDGTIYYIL